MKHLQLLVACLGSGILTFGQSADTSIFRFPIQMDSFVVHAARGGWDVQGFIRRVQNDTTFYKAFKTLHLVSFRADNDVRILAKDGRPKAGMHSLTNQTRINKCRVMHIEKEESSGDYYDRRGQPNYYTADLYAYLFLQKGTMCNETDIVGDVLNTRGSGSLERSNAQLKQLIFNPGTKVRGVPFMGDKASIWDADVARLYDFKLESVEYLGEDCYLFRAIPKPQHKSDVVYNELSTWFRKRDYSIVARDYSLSYHTALYDFDVRMKVRLGIIGGKLVPVHIDYDGNWYVFTKGRERGRFAMDVRPL